MLLTMLLTTPSGAKLLPQCLMQLFPPMTYVEVCRKLTKGQSVILGSQKLMYLGKYKIN